MSKDTDYYFDPDDYEDDNDDEQFDYNSDQFSVDDNRYHLHNDFGWDLNVDYSDEVEVIQDVIGNHVNLTIDRKYDNEKLYIGDFRNPPVPKGCKHVFGTWNKDFTIKTPCGNYFTFIPVGSIESNGTLDSKHNSEKYGRRNFLGEIFSNGTFWDYLIEMAERKTPKELFKIEKFLEKLQEEILQFIIETEDFRPGTSDNGAYLDQIISDILNELTKFEKMWQGKQEIDPDTLASLREYVNCLEVEINHETTYIQEFTLEEEYKLKSIQMYGGFYISSANISMGEDGNLQSKPGYMPITDITYDEAEKLASFFEEIDGVCFSLPSGNDYDSLYQWILEIADAESEEDDDEDSERAEDLWTYIQFDSSPLGNYRSNNIEFGEVKPTGSDYEPIHGFYDFTGNVSEWSTESQQGAYKVIRSGSCIDKGDDRTAIQRGFAPPDFSSPYIGLRVAMFIDLPVKDKGEVIDPSLLVLEKGDTMSCDHGSTVGRVAKTSMVVAAHMKSRDIGPEELVSDNVSDEYLEEFFEEDAPMTEEFADLLHSLMWDIPASSWMEHDRAYREARNRAIAIQNGRGELTPLEKCELAKLDEGEGTMPL